MLPNNQTANPGTGNEISPAGKFWAGLLLIVFTAAAIFFITAYWPNKMPPIKDGDDGAWYTRKCFNVTLIEKNNCEINTQNDSIRKLVDSVSNNIKRLKAVLDTIDKKNDSLRVIKKLTDSFHKLEERSVSLKQSITVVTDTKRIHLNTILLLLVALMGFLGNMIHIATSFTTFVGSGTFKKDWILWYFVKPFTAAGLAIIIYFIIRAGFLNYGSGASSVSLYGILSLAALAGLFTDIATLKLKEVFEVIFKPKDDRTGKLQGDELTVTSFLPETIPAAVESTFVIGGKNLNMADIKITIDGNAVTPVTKSAEKLEIKYTPKAGTTKAVFVIADKAGKPLYTKDILIK